MVTHFIFSITDLQSHIKETILGDKPIKEEIIAMVFIIR